MTKMIRTLAALAILAGLGIGCSKPEEPKPEKEAPAQKGKEKDWKPESADLPAGHSADDGHDHSDHSHEGHDH